MELLSIVHNYKYSPRLCFLLKLYFKRENAEDFVISVKTTQKYMHKVFYNALQEARKRGLSGCYNLEYYSITCPEEVNEIIKNETLLFGRETWL